MAPSTRKRKATNFVGEKPQKRKQKAESDAENEPEKKRTETSSSSGDRTIYCGGIPYIETEASIKKWFEENCGKVEDIELLKFPGTEDFRGIALIRFEAEEAVTEALGYMHCEW